MAQVSLRRAAPHLCRNVAAIRGVTRLGWRLEAGHRTCPPLPERDLPRPLAVLRLVAVHDLAAAELLPEGGGHHLAAADAPAAPAGRRVNESIVPPNWDLGSIPGAGVLSSEGFVEPRCFPTDLLICHGAQRQGVEVWLLRIVFRRGRGRRAAGRLRGGRARGGLGLGLAEAGAAGRAGARGAAEVPRRDVLDVVLDGHGVAGDEVVPLARPRHDRAVEHAAAQLRAVVHAAAAGSGALVAGRDLRAAVRADDHGDEGLLVGFVLVRLGQAADKLLLRGGLLQPRGGRGLG